MRLTVLALSSLVLSVTLIAGLITFYTIRNAGSAVHSVKAIYAAEAGLQLELYRWYKDHNRCHVPLVSSGPVTAAPWPPPTPPGYPVTNLCYGASTPLSPLSNGATFTTEIFYNTVQIGTGPSATFQNTIDHIKSVGQSQNSARALQANF